MPVAKSIPKGRKKVKKTRTTFDEKGYMVIEEYSSTEEIGEKEIIRHDLSKHNEESKKK